VVASLPDAMEPTPADLRLWRRVHRQEVIMGRGILLWLLGVPIPVIILLALIWH
jgi:hypothetical protein